MVLDGCMLQKRGSDPFALVCGHLVLPITINSLAGAQVKQWTEAVGAHVKSNLSGCCCDSHDNCTS
jgi:hypothetical protein